MRLRSALALSLCLLFPAARARADTVTITPAHDGTMYSEDGSLANGSGNYLFTGTIDDGPFRRALLSFDIAGSIPPGADVTSVTLRLTISKTRDQDNTVRLHRVTAAWGEGASRAVDPEGIGIMAQPGDATWTYRMYSSTRWSNAGGDYASTASASATAGRMNTVASWSSPQMVADVQAWLDSPSTNYGWIVVGDESTTKTAKRFNSRENADLATRPQLEITFTSTVASGACCAADGICTISADPGTACTGTYQGRNTTCSPNPCPEPAGACCTASSAASCAQVPQSTCAADGRRFLGLLACEPNPCPVALTPFVDPLPIPTAAQPTSGASGGEAEYAIAIRQITQRLHRDLPPTTLWVYDDGTGGRYPGPTIEARRDRFVTVRWLNDLRDSSGGLRGSHLLPVDDCIHGAHTPSARTVIHLHGGHVPAEFDGYPEATQLPGESITYRYPNWQEAATLWYHDHALGITRLNVYLGLAGFYLLRDDVEDALELPRGEYEIPLVIQDRTFRADGSLAYPDRWMEQFFGDTVLVNGAVWPYLEVRQGKYRFRIVNGSNSRVYTLALSNGASFTVIGGDDGLLDRPTDAASITIGPGERADVIVDFERVAAGMQVTLTNSAPAPFPGLAGEGVIPNVMRFRVVAQPGHTAAIPTTLRTHTRIPEGDAVIARDFRLERADDPCGGFSWRINGLPWSEVTEQPALGTAEIWRFINPSPFSHPIHMHLVYFEVLDRQLFDESTGTIVPVGSPTPPTATESGPKDTVMVGPNEIVRVIARFTDFVGNYAYHCHILEHEDHGMMRQFQTVTSCGDGARGLPMEECDDGNNVDGDGCTASCRLEAGFDGGPTPFFDGGPGGGGGGCGCRSTGGHAPPFALVVALFGFVLRRAIRLRRRSCRRRAPDRCRAWRAPPPSDPRARDRRRASDRGRP